MVRIGIQQTVLYLKRTAEIVCEKYNGTFPKLKEELLTLPGIGPATAGAVIAFAYHTQVIFIKTNIRRVFIYEFFCEKEKLTDQELYPLIEKNLTIENNSRKHSTNQ